jgi:hypothetical protein
VWCASVTAGYDQIGKRRRRVIYGATKGAVLEKPGRLQGAAATGTLIEPHRMTVAQVLDRWLEDSARPAVRRAKYRSYAGLVRNHINPQLGRPAAGQSLAGARAGRLRGDGARRLLSPPALARARGAAQGVRPSAHGGYLMRNPCDAVHKPRARGAPCRC